MMNGSWDALQKLMLWLVLVAVILFLLATYQRRNDVKHLTNGTADVARQSCEALRGVLTGAEARDRVLGNGRLRPAQERFYDAQLRKLDGCRPQ